jgi:light-regulated signal transduction histidine kinase (bacteriophytochrome)
MAELSRSNAELEQFAYVASHDLQEPLRMVSSYVQLLEKKYRDQMGDEADEFIEFAVDGARRMQELINDLLDYSRVGRFGKPFETVDMNDVLATALANLGVAIDTHQATVTHGDLPVVRGDRVQLVQVFQNLISNAIKFRGPEAPRVEVKGRREGDEWIFSVVDNGVGFDQSYSERIFQIFQRLQSRAESEGTGIGLAIASRIVQRHGGRIWAESEVGKGSVFYFSIPAEGG